jgi:hypothetical protein
VKKTAIAAILLLMPLTTPAAAELELATYNSAASKAHCSSEWGTDYSMVKYCIDKIEKGFRKYQAIETAAVGRKVFHGAMRKCKSEWGEQWDMVAYCAQKQLDGIGEISIISEELPEPQSSEIMYRCWNEWPDDFAMKAYCMRNQAAAWRAMQ